MKVSNVTPRGRNTLHTHIYIQLTLTKPSVRRWLLLLLWVINPEERWQNENVHCVSSHRPIYFMLASFYTLSCVANKKKIHQHNFFFSSSSKRMSRENYSTPACVTSSPFCVAKTTNDIPRLRPGCDGIKYFKWCVW